MNLTAHYGVSNPTELPQHIPSATVLEMAGVAYRNEQSWGTVMPASTIAQYRAGTDPVRYPDNDWFSLIDNKTKKEYRGLVEDGFIDLVNEIYEENKKLKKLLLIRRVKENIKVKK